MQIVKLIAIVSCALALFAVGCGRSRQVHNVDGLVVTQKANPAPNDIAQAIIRAGTNTMWRITDAGPGQLLGNRVEGRHTATITISYSPKNYQIALKESSMQDESGNVHATYNRWVQQLDAQIKFQLGGIN